MESLCSNFMNILPFYCFIRPLSTLDCSRLMRRRDIKEVLRLYNTKSSIENSTDEIFYLAWPNSDHVWKFK